MTQGIQNAHTFKKSFQCHIGKSSPTINYLQKYTFVWSCYLLVIIGSDRLKLSITLQIFSGNSENYFYSVCLNPQSYSFYCPIGHKSILYLIGIHFNILLKGL